MDKGLESNINDTEFIVCDVETTGMSPVFNRITEIALIKVHNGEIVDTFTSLINPQQHIPFFITNLTGISNDDVIDKPTFDALSQKITNFFLKSGNTNTIFTGHNVSFDYKFLKHSFLRLKNSRTYDSQTFDSQTYGSQTYGSQTYGSQTYDSQTYGSQTYGSQTYDLSAYNVKTLCTCKLARRLLKRLRSKSLINVAAYFGINFKRHHRAYDDALATAKILVNFINILTEEYEFENVDEILRFQNSKVYNNENKSPVLKRIKVSLKDFPKLPGVYFMKNRNEEILYIGKAKNLRERLASYFRFNSELPEKLRRLLKNISSIEYQITNSELSALILESKLIKEHKPRFNSAIKRFRFHPFLKIDVQNEFPKIEKVYEIENDGANYYGPFQSGLTVNKLLKEINEEFKLRKCDYKKLKPSVQHSTCMYYEMKKCDAPCNLSQSISEYENEVNRVHDFITSTEDFSAQKIYEIRMKEFSEKMEYERAAFVRDRLRDIQKVLSYQKVITSAINDKKIIIKCVSEAGKEIFFIQNGKLVSTYFLGDEIEFDRRGILTELTDTTEYLFFSLSKYVKHKYNPYELDEIKVISNWLALNRDKNSVMEINEMHSRADVLKFLSV